MIKIETLKKQFKKHVVLDDLSLDIKKGDRIAMIGINGAGKTTLIRCLMGEYIYTGNVSIAGLSPRKDRCSALKKIGFVPQIPPPLKMTVAQLIQFSTGYHGCHKDLVENVIQQLGFDLDKFKNHPFFKLSGGQKQKILIGIALGRPCEILLMDEPAANLDPKARDEFFKLIKDKPKDTIMIISSHRLEEVEHFVNRVIELADGKIIVDKQLEENNVSVK